MRSLLLAAALALAAGPALAAQPGDYFYDGNKLHEACQIDHGFCVGYVAGIVDSYGYIASYSSGPLQFCLPHNATAQQVSDVAVKYLDDNPAQRHMTAALLVLAAVKQAFPC